MPTEPALALWRIVKQYPGVRALGGVDFDVRAGEVHAVLGQNGAGKSTLLGVMGGWVRPDAGEVRVRGRAVRLGGPRDAERAGIGVVHQELTLVPTMTVAENVSLAHEPRTWRGIDRRRMRRAALEATGRLGLDVDPGARVGDLSAGTRQLVALARAVLREPRVLVLDEPTSSLDARETRVLLDAVGVLRARGLAIVLVTHFLEQAEEAADRVTVLRGGERVGTFARGALSRSELVERMLGRSLGEAGSRVGSRAVGDGPPALRARGVSKRGWVSGVDASVRAGEVVGFAGLLGSGRSEAARLMTGAARADVGTIEIGGRAVRLRSPRDAVRRGVGLAPEDRRAEGIVPGLSVRDNIVLVVQHRLSRWGVSSRRAEEALARELAGRLGIVLRDLSQPIETLSGGNQQKVVLARWMAARLRVLVLDEPTRGIDVGAKAEIERLVDELAGGGLGVVFISGELEEVVRRSDRVVVFRDRRVVGELGEGVTEGGVMRAIAG